VESSDAIVLVGRVSEHRFAFDEHNGPAHQVRVFLNERDDLLLRQLLTFELALFVCGTALVEELFGVGVRDPRLELLARRRILEEIVLVDVDALTFQVSDRIAAARSRRLEVHLHAFRHFCLTHHAPAGATCSAAGFAFCGACSSSISCTSGVQLPPQCPVVAVVQTAICAIVHAPLRMARSIVLYLMLLHRHTVLRPRTTGCRG
jgi:hypothetical protein